jgi:flagellar operon protein
VPKPVQFSGHALQRIESRGIPIDDGAVARLAGGVDRAAAKGSRSSLVLVDETAFVVSVPNRTVVTAVDREHMREQVFTNIDSAVIA